MKKLSLGILSALFFNLSLAVANPAIEVVKKYYEAYNKGDVDAQVAIMTDKFRHEPNQGEISVGKEKYASYAKDLKQYVNEKCLNVEYFASAKNPSHVIAEYVVEGKYVKSMEGYPKAANQKYKLPV